MQFGLENSFQSKVLWKAAVCMHVHFRVESNKTASCGVTLEKSKKFVLFGKKQVKFSGSPVFIRSIQPGTPRKMRKSCISLNRLELDDHSVKGCANEHNRSAKSSPSPSQRRNCSPASYRKETPAGTPQSFRHKTNKINTPETTPKKSHDVKVVSAIPARLRLKDAPSAQFADDHLSDFSDNTDELCRKSIIEKAFSYHEKDGINSISSWLELCSPHDTASERGRSMSKRAPSRRKYLSMSR